MLDLFNHYGDWFRMDRFCLVIIDECHNAIGQHSYAQIMKKYYHNHNNMFSSASSKKPRILGLTASPLVSVKQNHSDQQLETMLTTLERTLDATVTSAFQLQLDPTSQCDNNLLLKVADERNIIYNGYNAIDSLPSFETVGLHSSRLREFRQLEVLYMELGPKILAIYCKTLARELSCNAFERESSDQFTKAVQYLQCLVQFADELCSTCPYGGRSDKILALEQLLENEIECSHNPNNTVGLVFVERRITAMALHDYFSHRTQQLATGIWKRASELRFASSSSLSVKNIVP